MTQISSLSLVNRTSGIRRWREATRSPQDGHHVCPSTGEAAAAPCAQVAASLRPACDLRQTREGRVRERKGTLLALQRLLRSIGSRCKQRDTPAAASPDCRSGSWDTHSHTQTRETRAHQRQGKGGWSRASLLKIPPAFILRLSLSASLPEATSPRVPVSLKARRLSRKQREAALLSFESRRNSLIVSLAFVFLSFDMTSLSSLCACAHV